MMMMDLKVPLNLHPAAAVNTPLLLLHLDSIRKKPTVDPSANSEG